METHLAYPVLTYFRSSHDDESWVGTLGALLDASTLLITTLELDNRGQAELTLRIGTHLVRDFSNFFRLPVGDAAGVEYDEFVTAYRQLRELGAPLRPLEDAWPAFAAKRAEYAAPLDAMARWWRIPPARWIGDRSRVRVHVNVGVPRKRRPALAGLTDRSARSVPNARRDIRDRAGGGSAPSSARCTAGWCRRGRRASARSRPAVRAAPPDSAERSRPRQGRAGDSR